MQLRNYALLFLASWFFVSCKTPTPPKTVIRPPIVEAQPSFDGNVQDSGLKAVVKDKGFEISETALKRLNALIFIYGAREIPPIVENYGVSREGDKIYLSAEGMVVFAQLSQKFKRGDK